MPIRDNREYRTMPILARSDAQKRIDSENYVEGYATTFNQPYVLFSYGDCEYKEVIDRHALDGADMSDVVFQYNHSGRVFARTRMKQGKIPTMVIEPMDSGLFVAADLSKTTEARKMFEDIDAGLIYQMSWAFTVLEDSYNTETHTRTILKIGKVYDVSAVDFPANPFTDIASRWCGGVAETEKLELVKRERERDIQIINLLTMED